MSSQIYVHQKRKVNYTTTDRSNELIKKVYCALKKRKEFRKFQKDFHPLIGLKRSSEEHILDTYYFPGDIISLGELKYFPCDDVKAYVKDMPKFVGDARIIKSICSNSHNLTISTMGTDDVVQAYMETYYSKEKPKKTEFFVQYLFGIIFTLMFTIVFLFVLSLISKTVTIGFSVFIVVICCATLISKL